MMRWETSHGIVEIGPTNDTTQSTALESQIAAGLAHHQAGRIAEAERLYRACLAAQPDNPDALHLLGLIAYHREQHAQARRLIAAALSRQGNSAPFHSNYGEVCRKLGDFDTAIEHLERAITLAPGYAEAHNNLGCTYADMGRIEAALDAFRRAIDLEPGYAAAHNHYANMLVDLGRVDEAKTHYREALRLKPGFAKALAHLAMVAPGDVAAETLQAGLETPATSDEDRIHFHTALGAVRNHDEAYAQAFEHYLEANRLRRAGFDYDADAQSRLVDTIITNFSADWAASLPGTGNGSELPVFIVGMPRSGTTLVEQILSSHPAVHGAGELGTMELAERHVMAAAGEHARYPATLASVDEQTCAEAATLYLDDLRARAPQAARVTDKMPLNFLRLGLIRRLFPRARIFHCRRSPLDTCVSMFCANFKDTRGNAFAFDLGEVGRFYCDYERLMAHWQAIFPGVIFDVDYEALLDDQAGTTRAMVAHLGLPWNDACLDFVNNQRAVSTASNLQVRRPLYRSSVGRWRRYGEALEPLFEALGRHE